MHAIARVLASPARLTAGILLAATLTAPGPAWPAAGDLDPTFGSAGIVRAYVGAAKTAGATGVVLHPGGRILAIGSSNNGYDQSGALVRYEADGSLDTRWAGTGRVATQLASGTDAGTTAGAVQADGKTIVVGRTGDSYSFQRWTVARFGASGNLDSNFNGNGIAAAAFPGVPGQAVAAAVQADGKIVVLGQIDNGFGPRTAMARYNADGTLDAAFGTAGTVLVKGDKAKAVALQADGRIVVATYLEDQSGSNPAFLGAVIGRFNADGSLDTSFGDIGYQVLGLSVQVNALAFQADGRILGAGWFANPPYFVFTVVRLTTAGAIDAGFGTAGYTDIGFSQLDQRAFGIGVQSNGKIVVAGKLVDSIGLARLHPNGATDTTFGSLGKRILPIPSTGFVTTSYVTGGAMAIEDDDSIVVVGEHIRSFGTDSVIYAMRLTAGGNADKNFNGGNPTTTAAGLSYDGAAAVAIAPDGRIIAAGYSDSGGKTDIAVARFLASGSRDPQFNAVGSRTTRIGPGIDQAHAVVVQPDGKVLVAGASVYDADTGAERFTLVRYTAAGVLDTTFSGNGIVTLDLGSGQNSHAYAAMILPTGKILAFGRAHISGRFQMVLARFNDDGTLDATYGGGLGYTGATVSDVEDGGRALAMLPDGKLLLAGYSIAPGGGRQFGFVRIFANGGLADSWGFNASGKLMLDAASGDDTPHAMAVQPDGKVLVAGESGSNGVLIRLTVNGALDTSFASSGKLVRTGGAFRSVQVDANGRILLTQDPFRVIRLNADGTLDAGFASGGVRAVSVAPYARAFGLALQPDGTLVVAGEASDGLGEYIVVARLLAGDTTPDAFAFAAQAPVPRGAVLTSNTVTVAGFLDPTSISVAGGSYSIGCTDPFVSTPGTIVSGQTVCVRHTSAAGFGQAVTTTLTIGGISADFTSTTVIQAALTLTPSSLSFGSQAVGTAGSALVATLSNSGQDAAGISLGTLGDFVVSATTCTTALAGGANCAISLVFLPLATGGRIGELAVIAPNAMVPLLSITLLGNGIGGGPGGTSDSPDAFTFVDQFAVPVSTAITSAPVQITGLTGSALATAIGGEWCVSSASNCACDVQPFTRDPGAVANGQFVCVRHTSSPIAGNSTDTQFIVGGIGDTFTTTTIDIVPAPFVFAPATGVPPSTPLVSTAAVITGINAPSPVSVAGGEYSVGCTGTWASTAGTVANGQAVCVRHVAASGYSATTSTALTVGGVTGSFVSTTASATTIPRLANISTRMQVLTGNDVLIGGFIIGGTQAKTVVVRARGPSLTPFGITNALANPQLQLFSGQTVIASNDDWGTATNAAALQASGFAPENALEAAILTTLQPGAYTAIVSGSGGVTGVGIVEVFEVDLPEVPLANISTRGQVLTGNDVMIGGFVIQGNAPQTVIVRARGPSLADFGITNALQDPVLQLVSGQTVIAMNDDWQASTDAPSIESRGLAPANMKEAAILITLNPGAYTAIVTGAGGGTGVGIIEVFAQ